jgi:hypothetical protein
MMGVYMCAELKCPFAPVGGLNDAVYVAIQNNLSRCSGHVACLCGPLL